jgi:L-cysteine/cystine lyase
VDGAQSFGSLPLEAAAAVADIYAVTGHKWCCGPEGLGAVALSERLLAESMPTLIGWRSLCNEGLPDSAFHADARRFEVATSCLPLFAGLATSLQLLEAEGNAEQRLAMIRARSRQLWSGLQAMEGIHPLLEVPPPAGLVSFQLDGDRGLSGSDTGAALVRRLGEQGIWLRTLDDPPCVRACTHITTTTAEVDLLLETLPAIAQAS